ncbi:Uncharacterized protein B5E38_5019 [Bacillus cereus]|nr:Uncharacterized protein B5E38_5019 [Bacillus cereus]ARO65105.1 Uncharacterized protein B5E39_2734 [Bacillus cereus]
MKKLVAFLLCFTLLVGCGKAAQEEEVEKEVLSGVVVDKYNKRNGDVDKFYIVVDDGENEHVLENTDSIFFMKFDSADIQASIRVGKEYEFETFGFRIKSLSSFPNVTKVTKIQDHKE